MVCSKDLLLEVVMDLGKEQRKDLKRAVDLELHWGNSWALQSGRQKEVVMGPRLGNWLVSWKETRMAERRWVLRNR